MVTLLFVLVGAVFIPVGFILLADSEAVIEVTSKDYSLPIAEGGCLNPDGTDKNPCTLSVDIPVAMEPPVYFYYKLSKFYQNHRRYVRSRYDRQLRAAGDDYTPSNLKGICTYMYIHGDPDSLEEMDDPAKSVSPCGLVAWSLFNDSFYLSTASGTAIPLREEGIAWPTDVAYKFKNAPDGSTGQNYAPFAFERSQTCATLVPRKESSVSKCLEQQELTGPQAGWCYPGSGYCTEDEHFMVWMRTAGLPTFRKLYAIINERLEPGTVQIQVTNGRPCPGSPSRVCNPATGEEQTELYPVRSFGGTKEVVLSTAGFVGGKNNVLGYAYMVVGVFCFTLGLLFYLKHRMRPREPAVAEFVKEQHAAAG